VAPLHLFPCNKEVLVIHIRLSMGCFASLAIYCWLWYLGNIYSDTQILINNQIASKVKFCNSDLSSVLAMDCFLEVVINYWESLHQTYKSPLHRFFSLANISLIPNIQVMLGILHWWISSLSSQQQSTSLNHEEFDKSCMFFFSKWSKTIESK
jgi:heme A synthase